MYSIKVTEATIILGLIYMVIFVIMAIFGAITWDEFWSMMFIGGLMVVFLKLSVHWNRYKEKRTTLQSIESAKSDERGFFFLLRSFDFRELYETSGGFLDPEYRIPAGTTSVFSNLDKATTNFGNLVILRRPELEYEFDSTEYYWKAIIADGGKKWKSAYRYLTKHCKAIILIPATTKGSLYEIRTIRDSKLWKKTIVFMPPVHYKPGLWKYAASSDVEKEVEKKKYAAWEKVREGLLKENIHLPEYDKRGCVYLPNSDLSIRNGYHLPESGSEDERIRQGLAEILRLKSFSGAPTNKIFKRFKVNDAMLIWHTS